jgi:hypothetical protein
MRPVLFYFGSSPAAMLLVLWPACSAAQECQNRSAPVAFRNAQNYPIRTISVADLQAKVHGKPVKIVSLGPDRCPRRVVLLMDTSGSMHGIDKDSNLWSLELQFARHYLLREIEIPGRLADVWHAGERHREFLAGERGGRKAAQPACSRPAVSQDCSKSKD